MTPSNESIVNYQDFIAEDTNRIQGPIAESLARSYAYVSAMPTSVQENYSEIQRSVVFETAVPAGSLARPVYTASTAICGTSPANADQLGTTEYQYPYEVYRGQGPNICVWSTRVAFKGVYENAVKALQDLIAQEVNADIRANGFLKTSSSKFVCNSVAGFSNSLKITLGSTNGPWPQSGSPAAYILPDSPLSWTTAFQIMSILRTQYIAKPFLSSNKDGNIYCQLITDLDTSQVLYNDANVRADIRALTTGSFLIGEKRIEAYTWEGYRGIAIGIDDQPLRATGFDASGNLIVVEPIIAQPTVNGVLAAPNPAWQNAPYTVSFMLFGDAIERTIARSFLGESTVQFPEQLAFGNLEWYFNRDSTNVFGDTGYHIYQIHRGYKPKRPHFIVAILSKICPLGGIQPCSS
jgi:hypothetical protein